MSNDDKLQECRNKINEIDRALCILLLRRMKLCEDIAVAKKGNRISIEDSRYEKAKLNSLEKKIDKKYQNHLSSILEQIFYRSKLIQLSNMLRKNLVFIGMSGVGKTNMGEKLADILNLKFVDTDVLIEEKFNGIDTSDIITKYGLKYFRTQENKIISEFLSNSEPPQVISCGGGVILHLDLMQKLKEKSIIIYVQKSVNQIFRARKDPNQAPYFGNKQNITKIFKEREALYKKYTQLSVLNNKNSDKCIEQIVEYLITRKDIF